MDSLSPNSSESNPLKRCPRCPEGQQWHPATPEFWHRAKGRADGLCAYCKVCANAYYSQPDRREKRYADNRAYHKRPEAQERIYARHRADRRRPGMQEKRHVYGQERGRRPEVRERSRVWHATRRARKRAAPGTYTPEQIQIQLKRQKYRCYYLHCGQSKFPKDKTSSFGYRFEIEHLTPLSRTELGPRNDMSNIVLACESCNGMKHNKLPHEFFEGGRLL